jgi:hypothetical protein
LTLDAVSLSIARNGVFRSRERGAPRPYVPGMNGRHTTMGVHMRGAHKCARFGRSPLKRWTVRCAALLALVLLTAQCTVAAPTGDITGWHQVFRDDFTTDVPLGSFSGCSIWSAGLAKAHCTGLPAAIDAKWFAYPDGWSDSSGHGRYMPSKTISIHDGVMDLWLHVENGVPLVAAPMPKIPGATGSMGGLSAGRYEVRFLADASVGYKLAWMLWPDSGDFPHDGEIDFPETPNLSSQILAFMHRQGSTLPHDQDRYATGVLPTGSWHVATTEWKPGDLKFYLDGKLIGHSTQLVPNTPMRWILQTETVTGTTYVPTTADNAHVYIDYATVYVPT